MVNPISYNSILLSFLNAFVSEDTCSISFKQIADSWGNKSDVWIITIIQYIVPEEASAFDIVISEIMADPDPVVKLPNAEYLELFNRSDKYINLNQWLLKDASNSTILSDYILAPKSYLILCHVNNKQQFQTYGNVLGLNSFPSLGNTNDEIILKDFHQNLIFHINYSEDWYQSEFKKAGGYSLEMIDPENYCSSKENWMASNDEKGGTPGSKNSVDAINPDISNPMIEKILVLDSVSIMLFFNEKMDSLTITDPDNYEIKSEIGKGIVTEINSLSLNMVKVRFQNAIKAGESYKLTLLNLKDCAGNEVREKLFIIGLPEPLDSGDLIINEILFNPQTNGYDFVELYNRSKKYIDLKEILITNLEENGQPNTPFIITEEGYQIAPNDYVVLTENSEDIISRYDVKFPEKIININQLPSFNDDEGNALLINRNGNIYDKLYYHQDYHFELLKDQNGVSLERINPEEPSSLRENWHSAASDAGYATPTYRNSQFSETKSEQREITIEPVIFSPDGDGYNDLLKIIYNFDQDNKFGSINIYDIEGKLIKELRNNVLFGKEGFFIWDGSTLSGTRAATGVYIIVIQVNGIDGTVKKYKKTCTLSLKTN